ncbi:hypothetical protein E1B28_003765 [Marasmius oreades]|uniref:Uncharacterized protein n=1 Tax=Marasmius oreades TaxID=181124 RepID=A0A9P7UXB1_9AGAR|nr:uncharacterized protein E1B28_003765 [Marasmius oreades]KAG7096320.1 hypothetical protein E1B28_003765 [Marasmius oreades]
MEPARGGIPGLPKYIKTYESGKFLEGLTRQPPTLLVTSNILSLTSYNPAHPGLRSSTKDTTKERNPPETKQSAAASKSSSLWSLLTVPFSCEAFEGSDIPAMLM